MHNHYSQQEESFILDNYPTWGPKYCSIHLSRPAANIEGKAKRMGIKKIGTQKHPSMQKIDPNQFWDIQKPEVAYLLGYLWADGYIIHKEQAVGTSYKISLEISSEDQKNISEILESLGQWSKTSRKREVNWKETTTVTTNSKDIYEFLFENDYKNKSYCEPTKILKKIPKQLHKYFWRGFFDGDGSFSFAEKNNRVSKCLQFSSTINYEWTELKALYSELGVSSYGVLNCTNHKGHSSSRISIQNYKDIGIILHYFLSFEMGLSRKTDKMRNFTRLYHDKL